VSQKNVDVVRRGYELFAAGDVEGVARLFSDEAEMPGAGGLGLADTAPGTVYGPGGFLQATDEALEAFDDYRVEPEQFIDAGQAVVVPVRISGRGRASGARLEMGLAHVWVLRNGKVIHGEVHRNTREALESVGCSE
jgi:uncharacterized protein